MENKTGTLKTGLKVGDQLHKEFELRPATAGDYFDAEEENDSGKAISFKAALTARQLVRVGTFEGPFSLGVLRRLSPPDLKRLMDARDALEREGEGEQLG